MVTAMKILVDLRRIPMQIFGTEIRSASCGEKTEEIGVESLQFGEEIQRLMATPLETNFFFITLPSLGCFELRLTEERELEKTMTTINSGDGGRVRQREKNRKRGRGSLI
ncbi:hypothetical protein CsSME_00032395 [Camellia sinensis var. sinensis]